MLCAFRWQKCKSRSPNVDWSTSWVERYSSKMDKLELGSGDREEQEFERGEEDMSLKI